MDIQNINVPNIIKSNQYSRFAPAIKNYEDTLQKLLSNNKESTMTNDPYTFLWEVDPDLFPHFKNNIESFCVDIFGQTAFSEINKYVVVTGPYVRSCLVEQNETKNVSVIKELYLYRTCEEHWDQIIDVSNFDDRKGEYVFESEDKKIFLIKKKYKHPAHVILQYDYLKRVGYCNGVYWVSSMFLIEIQKHLELLGSKFSDPILNMPYDPLEIYKSKEKDKMNPAKFIEIVDFEELAKMPKKYFCRLYNGKTCLELCLDKYMSEHHSAILNQLSQMVVYLSSLSQIKRPIILYAKMIGLEKKSADVFNFLKGSIVSTTLK